MNKIYYKDHLSNAIEEAGGKVISLTVDCADLREFDSDLAEDYRSHPAHVQDYPEAGVGKLLDTFETDIEYTHVQITNLPTTLPLEEIRSKHPGRLIQVHGTVSSTSSVQSLYTEAQFECQRCGTQTYIPKRGQSQWLTSSPS